MKITKNIEKKCKKIKMVLTDVDGVLTDGGMYYSNDGEIMKKFNTRDGMGVKLLSERKIGTIIITSENSSIVKKRGKKIKVLKTYVGISKKELLLPEICKKHSLSLQNIAYIGDDVNDFEIMSNVGFSCTPNDGSEKIKEIVDYVTTVKGGSGVFREVTNLILKFN
jgi:YrbI family 3-deoxy-D-manno-octulosonate 8-phosphate phosphatase